MDKNDFLNVLRQEIATFRSAVSTQNGDWTIKGFIDIAKNIYTISTDTKVISKVMELLLFPELLQFSEKYHLEMILAAQQNFYPDISFRDKDKNIFALDLKSTYRIDENYVNGMTLGTFTGYFRARKSTRNITFPYESYKGHFVLGIIYSKKEISVDERRKYSLNEIESITSVIENLEFLFRKSIVSHQTNQEVETLEISDQSQRLINSSVVQVLSHHMVRPFSMITGCAT